MVHYGWETIAFFGTFIFMICSMIVIVLRHLNRISLYLY